MRLGYVLKQGRMRCPDPIGLMVRHFRYYIYLRCGVRVFKETIVASKLRENIAYYLNLAKGRNVVQILHRGQEVKVLMSQNYYLSLLAKLALYEKDHSEAVVDSKTFNELENSLIQKLRLLQEEDSTFVKNKMGKTGPRKA